MDILNLIDKYAHDTPDFPVYRCGDQTMTYGELACFSDCIASWLLGRFPGSRLPVVVYGHKEPLMIASFLGCMKAGRAYCPVDKSIPEERIGSIIRRSGTDVVIAVSELVINDAWIKSTGSPVMVSCGEILKTPGDRCTEHQSIPGLLPEEIAYIIFTSGSTGQPKGVQIPYGCLCSFTAWSVTLGGAPEEKRGAAFLNQAPFSFDLSVMDLYTCLASGGTLCPLTKETQNSYALLFETIKKMSPAVWVSTPSFAELCLSDPGFDGNEIPSLRTFLFCGERLTNSAARKLLQRFPEAKVINTYGPTESTVAVTDVEITEQMCMCDENLPVGRSKPGCRITIVKDGTICADGEAGEIVISGDTLSAGYLGDEAQTAKAFRSLKTPEGEAIRAYYTGDEGYLKEGMLYFNGRLDQQVKLHGYRIELGDIESNLLKIPEIGQACVIPVMREGRVNSLTAAVCTSKGTALSDADSSDGRQTGADRARAKQIKEALRAHLPEYMIPKKIVFVDRIPMTENGKADRKRLMEYLSK